jgi:putative DNA primase/helicase
MLDGCVDWQQHGLIRPSCVIAETEAYFEAQDLLGQWLDDACDAETGNTAKIGTNAELYGSWKRYAEAAGDTPGTLKSFGAALVRRGFVRIRNKMMRGFRGLRLKPVADRRSGMMRVTGDSW